MVDPGIHLDLSCGFERFTRALHRVCGVGDQVRRELFDLVSSRGEQTFDHCCQVLEIVCVQLCRGRQYGRSDADVLLFRH